MINQYLAFYLKLAKLFKNNKLIFKYEKKESGCCKPFNPKPWQNKTITWKDKLFLKDRIATLFYMPLNFGAVVVKNVKKIEKAKAVVKVPLMLSECSMFNTNIYIAVSKKVPDSKMEKISGTVLSKVFEGDYSNMGRWIKEMNEYVKSKGKKAKKLYFFYTTCPACAKFYGKNYTVVLARV